MRCKAQLPGLLSWLGVVLAVVSLCGCPAPEQKKGGADKQKQSKEESAKKEAGKPAGESTAAPESSSKTEKPEAEKPKAQEPSEGETDTGPEDTRKVPADLGDPLVNDLKALTQLDKASPVWLDKEHTLIVVMGSVCKADYPLEFFATYPDRGYESVVVVYTKPSIVHAALLALGAKPGKPVQYEPTFTPPSGTEVAISVCWKDKDGKRQKARAQDWVRDIKTKKPLDVTWVFAGSVLWEDKDTGDKSYLADRGDFISVLNLPTALLDVPIKSASAIESRLFEGFVERLPAQGTPVTLILKPKLEAPPEKPAEH